jgi:hypothetical protein
MRFRFSILTLLFWTALIAVTLAVCMAIPSMKHDIEYIMGMLPPPKGIPRPEFDEVVARFFMLFGVELFVIASAKALASLITGASAAVRESKKSLVADLSAGQDRT